MNETPRIAVIIPALNEEDAIGQVLAHLPLPASSAAVVDNGSTDRLQPLPSRQARGWLLNRDADTGPPAWPAWRQPGRGHHVFLDADFSEEPEQMHDLLAPIMLGEADFALGARVGPGRPWHARLGTRFCVASINLLWGTKYSDLGPFRVIRRPSLDALRMTDRTWGWTIEMQVKAAEAALRTVEVPVRTRPRIGRSKISGSVTGTMRAAARMIAMIVSLRLTRHERQRWKRRRGGREGE
jgi:hypothetical protein